MSLPQNDPNHQSSKSLEGVSKGEVDSHDQDLIEWLDSYGIRSPDWTIDPCVLDKGERRRTGEKNPLKLPNHSVISGVYLFYSRSKDGIVALYVGKAANLWNRMQKHWCHPEERGWIYSFLDEIDRGALEDIVMACAWKEDERAGVEAKLIKILKPRYCRRTE
jgi:hypothetical protein